ncbi:unnamed protein product [Soboliphyme baturini]|uniref:Arrestin_N domain-containing protein n=1 Tax=Soboliphyme baturini TaxID=241478 RepID=A0A183INB9_9BILA|nr:unnamed protein product [Soboliphyme baturini]
MGKLRNVDIRYERQPVFAGSRVIGSISFDLKEEWRLEAKDLTLSVTGEAKVKLGANATSRKWLLREYIPFTVYLMQYEYSLPAGHHQIQFSFLVPAHLPSSFGGKYGYVYYSCSLNKEFCKRFLVIGIEDLNWYPLARHPVNFTIMFSTGLEGDYAHLKFNPSISQAQNCLNFSPKFIADLCADDG